MTQIESDIYKLLEIPESEYAFLVDKLGRKPNDTETYLFSSMWSERCKCRYSDKYLNDFYNNSSKGLLIGDSRIFLKSRSFSISSFDDSFKDVSISAAAVVSDILAEGARPVSIVNSIKSGSLTNDESKHFLENAVKSISSYSNALGIPTVSGELIVDDMYNEVSIINIMALGVSKNKKEEKTNSFQERYLFLIGQNTGKDGFFYPSRTEKEKQYIQIGDSFIKKILMDASLEIMNFEKGIKCQNCAYTGLLSATCIISHKENSGIELYLDSIPLIDKDMQPWEIILSESQNRMIFSADSNMKDKIFEIAKKYNISASVIGKTICEKEYRVFMKGEKLADIPIDLLSSSPLYSFSEEEPGYIKEYECKSHESYKLTPDMIKTVISNPNFASKKWIYSQYDSTVGNRTALKAGSSRVAGLWLYEEGGYLGLSLSSASKKAFLNPYEGSKNAIWSAYRNLVSSGFKPIGAVCSLRYGSHEKIESFYKFKNSLDGVLQACKNLDIPLISDDFYFFDNCKGDIGLSAVPTVGMIGYVNSDSEIIKNKPLNGDVVFLLGKEISESSDVGGSLYQRALYNFLGGPIDITDPELEKLLEKTIFELRDRYLITSCNDISEGGLFCTLVESLHCSNLGFSGNLIKIKNKAKALFGEITGRYVITSSDAGGTEKFLESRGIPFSKLGCCFGDNIEFDGFSFEKKELFDLYDNSVERIMEL